MRIIEEQSASWMSELGRQLARGKHVLLYGNVNDLFLLTSHTSAGDSTDDYVSVGKFLDTYLTDAGYQIVSHFDRADGLVLVNPQTMEPLLDQALQRQHSAGAPNGTGSPAETSVFTSGEVSAAPPDGGITDIRHLLVQTRVPSAVIIDFADLLNQDPERPTREEQPPLVQLHKAIQAMAYAPRPDGSKLRNVLILVTGQLGRLPGWLYRGNPSVALVEAKLPDLTMRRHFMRCYAKHFSGGDSVLPAQLKEIEQQFADLTDGLTNLDLNSIRVTSRGEDLPLTNVKNLVDYYKFGRRENPWAKLDRDKIATAVPFLEKFVIGQHNAITRIERVLVSANVGITAIPRSPKADRPRGVFLFVGSTGVGKTELAKALTELVFGDRDAFLRIDMSEFMQEHSSEKLIGSPPGYSSHEEGGVLTEWVRQHPFSLILFDEFEKAHPNIFKLLLQVIDDGRLTDGKGQTVNFGNTILVFTSNIGSGELPGAEVFQAEGGWDYDRVAAHFKAEVEKYFKSRQMPEVYGRFQSGIVPFDVLRPVALPDICRKFSSVVIKSAQERCGLTVEISAAVTNAIVTAATRPENLASGARPIRDEAEQLAFTLNDWVFKNSPKVGTTVAVDVAVAGDIRSIRITQKG